MNAGNGQAVLSDGRTFDDFAAHLQAYQAKYNLRPHADDELQDRWKLAQRQYRNRISAKDPEPSDPHLRLIASVYEAATKGEREGLRDLMDALLDVYPEVEADVNDRDEKWMGFIAEAEKDPKAAAAVAIKRARSLLSAGPPLLTWAEYKNLADALPDGEFIIPGLYRRGQSSLMVGEPKAGKSTLCRQLAVQVARGGDVLGYAVQARTAVYMPLQEDPQHVVREIEKVHEDPGVRLRLHNPGQPMEWDRLTVELVAIDAALVIVDMVSDFKAWDDGNNYDEMKEVIGKFTRLARDTNAHVLLVHHGKKAPTAAYPVARVLGSQAIAGEVDVVASIHRDPDKGRIFQAEGRGIGAFERPL